MMADAAVMVRGPNGPCKQRLLETLERQQEYAQTGGNASQQHADPVRAAAAAEINFVV
ncbi:hypothetical protein GCM10007387_24840 [Pseudoduganella albidiflava]|uniref:Uncharacterized protein n=1 Tax=Pseudoduganella albidiflava TaxID=321983 RepID=A0AA88C2Z6_9BURK|nr:hypothetical protein GCM10007387_24840 [Pseudoduganella albidiflava]